MSGATLSPELQFVNNDRKNSAQFSVRSDRTDQTLLNERHKIAVKADAKRIDAIDLARGIAVALMILSHGVKGLLSFEDIPSWGLVPIHLITKFSSSLFILIFGVALAAAVLPSVGTEKWQVKRKKLIIRGLVVFFWYKVLTIVEMIHLYSREDILNTLLYKAFPVYVEILGFYAIALIWVPLVLPMWKKMGMMWRTVCIALLALSSHLLYNHFHFWGSDVLQALFVEHEKHYTWSQLSRAPLIFVGLMIGEAIVLSYQRGRHAKWIAAGALASVSALFFFLFTRLAESDLSQALRSIALNEGKHPPEQSFMLFSLAGAFLILAATVAGGKLLANVLKPLTLIGRDALQSFIFHIFVIFVFYRYLFDLWKNVSYSTALTLACSLILMTSIWVKATTWVRRAQ